MALLTPERPHALFSLRSGVLLLSHIHPTHPPSLRTPTPPHRLPRRRRLPLQLSVLRLFETVLSDVAIRRNPDHADLLALAKDTTRRMFAR